MNAFIVTLMFSPFIFFFVLFGYLGLSDYLFRRRQSEERGEATKKFLEREAEVLS